MRFALPLGLATLLCAMPAPAYSTGTIECRSAERPGLQINLVVGWGSGPMIAQARIVDGGDEVMTGDREPHPRIAQSWLDDRELRLHITDWNLDAFVARMRANSRRAGGPYVGTLEFRDRTVWLTCTSDDG